MNILDIFLLWGSSYEEIFENILRLMCFGVFFEGICSSRNGGIRECYRGFRGMFPEKILS